MNWSWSWFVLGVVFTGVWLGLRWVLHWILEPEACPGCGESCDSGQSYEEPFHVPSRYCDDEQEF